MLPKNQNLLNWIILFTLGAVWGSSFILMKIGAKSLDFLQIAAMRNGIVGLITLPMLIYKWNRFRSEIIGFSILCSLLGNGIPSVLYAYAAKYIDSNINGVINSLTPIFTMLFGIFFFRNKISKLSILGIIVGFVGVFVLFFTKGGSSKQSWIIILPLISTMMYGLNTNLIKQYLSHLSSLDMLTLIFGVIAIPAIVYLIFDGVLLNFSFNHFSIQFWQTPMVPEAKITYSITAVALLGIMNSFLSSLLFYYFIKQTTAIFASMTTYLIPIMSIFWGFVDHESIGWLHAISLATILLGVALVSKRK